MFAKEMRHSTFSAASASPVQRRWGGVVFAEGVAALDGAGGAPMPQPIVIMAFITPSR